MLSKPYADEVLMVVSPGDFKSACLHLHKTLRSPVMMLFATDERADKKIFCVYAVFMDIQNKKWVVVRQDIPENEQHFDSLAKDIYSASLFEREIKESFGLEPMGNPDTRRLNLHSEVWPEGSFPLRKDFNRSEPVGFEKKDHVFTKVEGDGIFEVPVGPVHAGIIGPGHFRFSCAGEPIINLEIRLGFAHRGVEKIFEGKRVDEAVGIAQRVCGDASFAHALSFCRAVEKINNIVVPQRAEYIRAIYLELERMYNHVNDIGGIAVDVGFSFPAALASIIKESILSLNERLTQSRYLKGAASIGGVAKDIDDSKKADVLGLLGAVMVDFKRLADILNVSVSFMDRVDGTGVLKKKTAEDLGVVGLAARASGIPVDLRKDFPGAYGSVRFKIAVQETGDVLARLRVRIAEFETSVSLIRQFLDILAVGPFVSEGISNFKDGEALGYVEGWRGPVLYWVKTSPGGSVFRCKIVDPSFHNWQGLSFSVLGDIIPDFPLCNKSFDLSYPGNDL